MLLALAASAVTQWERLNSSCFFNNS